jgi:antitoxin FitA
MQSACCGSRMATIQIRDVSEATRRRLADRAANAGLSLSEFLRRELDLLATVPTTADWLERLDSREPADVPPAVETIDAGRRERDRG